MNNEILVTRELRPCIAKGRNALFHTWEHWATVVGDSFLRGGHSAGQISLLYGICEFEDGSIERIDPVHIKFTDNRIDDYSFIKDGGCVESSKHNIPLPPEDDD